MAYLRTNYKRILILSSLFFCCAIFILFFSYTTSLLYPYYFGNDSVHFMTIALGWKNGKIPYKDLFDHKGPLIYFIDLLGLCLTGSKTGISIIQFIFLCFTITAIYKISLLYKDSNFWAFLVSILSLLALQNNYNSGNTVDEYCLPFICWSYYGFVLWFRSERTMHPARWSFLYGCTCGVCLLTRATNAVPISGALICIIASLILKKKYKNLLHNFICGISGLFCILLPFILYFYSKNALNDMIYDSILFNIDYSKGCQSWLSSTNSIGLAEHLQGYFLFRTIFFLLLLKILSKDTLPSITLFFTAFCETILFTSNYDFPQYPLVCLPQFTLLLNELLSLSLSPKKDLQILYNLLLFRCAIFLYAILSTNMIKSMDIYNNSRTHLERNWEALFDLIPSDERNSFVTWVDKDHYLKEVYFLENITPSYKFFTTQVWLADFSDQIQSEIVYTFQNGDAKWILTDNGDTSLINTPLSEKYRLYATWNEYSLFQKLEK